MYIEPRDIESLIELFEASDWDEMQLKVDGLELFLSRDPNANRAVAGRPNVAMPGSVSSRDDTDVAHVSKTAPVASSDTAAIDPAWVPVTAPNLGTFYRAPKPGAAPFVELGQQVIPQTEICLIEVMKLFTTLKAGLQGTVKRICVQDAAMVEFGDILFYVDPR